MALSTTTSSITHQGNGATTSFPYGFPILDASHAVITLTDNTVSPAATITLANNQYVISGIGNAAGGTVVCNDPATGAAIAAGKALTIRRLVPYRQSTSLINQDGFYPDVLEDALDYQTMAVQQLAEQQSRSVMVPVGSSLDPSAYLTLAQAAQSGAQAAAAAAQTAQAAAASSQLASSGSAAASEASRQAADTAAAATAADRQAVAADQAAAHADRVAADADASATAADRTAIATDRAAVAADRATVTAAAAQVATDAATTHADRLAADASAAVASAAAASAQAATPGAVKVSETDTASGKLDAKLAVSGQLTKTISNAGGNEVLTLSVQAASPAETQALRDQLALTDLRLMLATSVASGALMQGYQWELVTDEWASGSSGYVLTSGTPNYYLGPGPVKAAFACTGADQTWTVPAGVTSVTVKLWGAGGGATFQTAGSGNADWAGGGGYVSGTLPVTPGETLTLVVGQGGAASTGSRYGGGGGGANGGGSGGGRSAIRRGSTDIVTVGGGGGSGNTGNNQQVGGAGGGLIGGDAVAVNTYGRGGTQSSGGTGYTSGSQYHGGDAYAGSGDINGGGGGGYFGGGSGGNPAGGGGGSSNAANLIGTVVNHQASGYVAAGTGDADYVAGIGYGQLGSDSPVGNGRIVISYPNSSMTLLSPTVPVPTAPSAMVGYCLYKDASGTAIVGTDVTMELSRDGTTWVAAPVTIDVASVDGVYGRLKGRVSFTTEPSGTAMRARIKALNSKVQLIAAPAVYKE